MTIAVTSTTFSTNEILRKELIARFPDSKFNEDGRKLENKGLVSFLNDADGMIVGLERIDRNVIDYLPTLKIISKYGVGLDNIDIEYCTLKGIKVRWTPGVNKLSVAEMTVAFMVMLARNFFFTSFQLKNGTWNKNGGSNLTGKTVGLIGIGNIGKEVIRLLQPFRCRILVNDILDQHAYYKQNNLEEASKEYIYRNADFISTHTPFTNETTHLINRDTLKIMKSSSFLINTARGGIVNKEDLKWALMNGVISGAAIDVYEEEPPKDIEFLNLPNLICTPHIGGNSNESVLAMGRVAIKHLADYFDIIKSTDLF